MPETERQRKLREIEEQKAAAREERLKVLTLIKGGNPPPAPPVPKSSDMVPLEGRQNPLPLEAQGPMPPHVLLQDPIPVEFLGDEDKRNVRVPGGAFDFVLNEAYADDEHPKGRRIAMVLWADVAWHILRHPTDFAIATDVRGKMAVRKLLDGWDAHAEVLGPKMFELIRGEVEALVREIILECAPNQEDIKELVRETTLATQPKKRPAKRG